MLAQEEIIRSLVINRYPRFSRKTVLQSLFILAIYRKSNSSNVEQGIGHACR